MSAAHEAPAAPGENPATASAILTVREVEPDDAAAHRLWKAQERDLAERYEDPELELETTFPTLVGSWVGDDDGVPVATLVARWSPYEGTRPGDLELKRLWVEPTHRGRGHSKVIMRVAEEAGRRAGATRLILETGLRQPEAMALYERLGYRRMTNYGEYADEPESVCYAKDLPTRVLVLNGTMGAGKTTTAAAVHDLLAERGARSVFVDGDYLCQATPADPADPHHQRLMFASLAALAPLWRAAGYGFVVLPRVVEDGDDRARYAAALSAADAGLASVAVVRVTASEATRLARLTEREPAGYWRDMALARTVELEGILDDLRLDDAVVTTEGRDRLEVAAEVMRAAGWQ
ncbi:MAG: GNAT family N-acetyltransferase [Demequina sp.]|uniref:GNAT family N-acetyltransferase n=1 Tax=Demequina sp. TaxID=2050685 RepID=UPI003A84E9E8